MMRLRAGSRAPIAALAKALVLAGCGSGGSSSSSSTSAAIEEAARAAARARRAAESRAPKGASPTLGAIYRRPSPTPK
jgi:L-asparaginase/Glu-tRNA(Gln) amidotransferase subunit D